MARKKKTKPIYASITPDNDSFVMITRSMITSSIYMKLPDSAKTLYMYMRAWSNGKPTVEYAQSMAKEYMSSATFYRSIKRLLADGFIEYETHNRYGQIPNVYRFSRDWVKHI